jgi:hypothetical protein
MKHEDGITIYIGKTDIFEWTQGVGKNILMPKLFNASETLIKDDLESKIAARVKFLEGERKIAYDFVVTKDGISDTLQKILEWAIEEEEYEMCSEIKKLQEKVYAF